MWKIDKEFSFAYGHRVWSQKLIASYCENGDGSCKCKFLHGHEGQVKVFLEAEKLQRGMVVDFKMLGWLKNFIDDNIDHKFILDVNDPWFVNIINGEPIWSPAKEGEVGAQFSGLYLQRPTNTSSTRELTAIPAYVPGTKHLAGFSLDVSEMSGPEQEFFGSFFIVSFVPTSEHLSQWLYHCVKSKMDLIDIKVSRIEWNETAKSRAQYSE